MLYPPVVLNKQGLQTYLKRHLWFTQKEIKDFKKTSEKIAPGDLVTILSEENHCLGIGYFNPRSFYCLKLLSREEQKIDEKFFLEAFTKALKLRKSFYPGEGCFRLVFSEGDFIPGLIVDIFEKVVVVQIHTLGMERLVDFVIEALKVLFTPQAIVLKNDHTKRQEEGLPLYTKVVYGNVEDPILVTMDGIKFLVPVITGQKTGFFLDQRENRRAIARFSKGLQVIDGFSYIGGFGFYCLKSGADRVFFIDRSANALLLVEEIAKINHWKEKVITLQGDVFHILKNPPKVDMIILDPPAFIKSHKHVLEGEKKYETLYFLGLKALERGFFFGFSCSHFLKFERLLNFIKTSLKRLQVDGKIIFKGIQAKDHPINPFVEETFYLKGVGLYIEK